LIYIFQLGYLMLSHSHHLISLLLLFAGMETSL